MEKKIYALTYCYEGYEGCEPYAATIAVSESFDKLSKKMLECVEKDTKINEEDEWSDDGNYRTIRTLGDDVPSCVFLQHKKRINLYAEYSIHEVEII